MPFETRCDGDTIWIRFFGQVTAGDLARMAGILAEFEDQAQGPIKRVADFTDATNNTFTADDVRGLSRDRSPRNLPTPGKSAIIAPNDADFGDARMYEMLNTRPGLVIRVFRTGAEAVAWLGASDE